MNVSRGSKSAAGIRPLAAKIFAISLFVLGGYFIADLAVLWSRQYMLPSQPPPVKPRNAGTMMTPPPNLDGIMARNIFNSDGIDPEALIAKQGPGKSQEELPPVPSQLPITLIGTLVHSNPEKSLAALELKGKNTILSFRPKMDIENLATLEKVERMKVIFRNKNSGRLEFIEMKNASKMPIKATVRATGGEVKKTADNEFEIKRSDLLKYTTDLSSVLMQARVVPARRGGSGDIYGFRLVEMQPGSIYSQLGLQVMDVITSVNGNPVTSAQQAMETYTVLKNSNAINIGVERGGKNENLKYKITN